MMEFLFKYPTLGRPEGFKHALDKYYQMLSSKHRYKFLITLNSDDPTMNNDDMRTFMGGYTHLEYRYGKHKTKVEAINADMEGEDFDILFLISDDMIPVVPGFDDVIAKEMKNHFPNLDGALHYNDSRPKSDDVITLSIMGKRLYNQFGYIYHPDYNSFFCDNEFTDEVQRTGKVVYFPEVIIKHDYKITGTDATYDRNSRLGRKDGKVYKKRKLLGFPKGKVNL